MPLLGVITNGTFYSNQLADVLKKYDFSVTFSLDGWKEINDMQRIDLQNKGSHDKVVRNIQAYKNAGLSEKKLMIEVTYTQNHINQKISPLELIQYVVNTIGIRKVMIAPCISQNELGISSEEMFQLYENNFVITQENLKTIGSYIDYNTLSSIRKLFSSYSCEFMCVTGHKNVSILPDGKIYPCHMFLTEDYCMGTYVDSKWVLNDCNSVLCKLSEAAYVTKPDRCKQCWARNICFFCPGLYSPLEDSFIFGCGSMCSRELLMEKLLLITAAISQKPDSFNYLKDLLAET